MNTTRTAAWAFTAGPVLFLTGEAISAAAWQTPSYSYLTNWISDLGVPDAGTFQGRQIDSPLHLVMNTGFVLGGIAFLIGVLLLARTLSGRARRSARILGIITAAGYILVGAFHTSTAAMSDGTIGLHFAGAFLVILGGNILAIILGIHWWKHSVTRGLGHASAALGALGLVAVIVLAFTATSDAPNGLIERVAVYTILLWQLRVALHLKTQPSTSNIT
ncbi:DUF998 domain-containing protein [Brevibacterium picturae]|uniref:DUF998 domain-containing protein n=1 Tax=Brevibacterium picturae TaxID=260553 RepID=A0ABN2CS61_9MICO